MTPIVLYIHVPFCRYRCDYCDFFTRTHVPAERQLQIVNRTISQALDLLHQWYPPGAPISSVYIGGGTPSSLCEPARARLIRGIEECIAYGTLIPESEITVEINPEDTGPTLLHDLHHAGVNRISLGVQSLDQSTLARIGRHTTLPATVHGLELISQQWGEQWGHRWSVDVITAIPGQSITEAEEDLRRVLEFRPSHVSLYELGIEPGTRLAHRQRRGALPVEADEHRMAQWEAAATILPAHGLRRYEVSSFAVPGMESRHNLSYWRMHPWAAAGPGAVGLLPYQGRATHLTSGRVFQQYLERDDYSVTSEPLTSRELCEEYLMGGFRMTQGISTASLTAVFGKTLPELIPSTLEAWRHHLHSDMTTSVALRAAGQLLLNRFLVDAFTELERSVHIPATPTWPEATPNSASIDTTAT
ncbi:MAG TPA: radical SAM family heme chaperone HemW [Alkalispirochaeta sp.]|nr:radical SAM family heme chaperone HemW [Alkalispirochaeta sp.]